MKYPTGGKEMRVLFFKTLLALAMAGLLASPVYAADAGIRVEQAWARASIGTSRPAAAFVTVSNTSNHAVTLTGLTRSVAGMVEVHETGTEGTILHMATAGPTEAPAGATAG